jgi:hypothetical protein
MPMKAAWKAGSGLERKVTNPLHNRREGDAGIRWHGYAVLLTKPRKRKAENPRGDKCLAFTVPDIPCNRVGGPMPRFAEVACVQWTSVPECCRERTRMAAFPTSEPAHAQQGILA